MSEPCLRLTTYFGERARAGGSFLADALIDIYARHRLKVSLVMRGVEGFGSKHQMRTDRLLSLSEDLPLVAYAVDHRPPILGAVEEVRSLRACSGLTTLEPASLITRSSAVILRERRHQADRLPRPRRARRSPFCRPDRRRSAARSGRCRCHRLTRGRWQGQWERERARFFARNHDVPLMVIAVGDGPRISALVPELQAVLVNPLLTLEEIQICKHEGSLFIPPQPNAAQQTAPGTDSWQKLMVFASERARYAGRPVHRALVEELHNAGAAGATSLRGHLVVLRRPRASRRHALAGSSVRADRREHHRHPLADPKMVPRHQPDHRPDGAGHRRGRAGPRDGGRLRVWRLSLAQPTIGQRTDLPRTRAPGCSLGVPRLIAVRLLDLLGRVDFVERDARLSVPAL